MSIQQSKPRPTKLTRQKIWQESRRWLIMFIGIFIASFSYALFQVPFNIAAGGVGGLSIIINDLTGFPVGTMYLLMNIPLLIIGYFYLGRWQFVFRTIICVLLFSSLVDLFTLYLPTILDDFPITDNVLLSAIYAAMVGGLGGGLVYRAGSTLGGTGILGRIIQNKTGMPLSQIYLYTDGTIVLLAGITFGWELALYAMLTLFLGGIASDYILEGPSSIRTAIIITDMPQEVSQALMDGLDRGVSQWEITGGYSRQKHIMLYCTIYRPQVTELKRIVAQVDKRAFVTIGMAHQALGAGFSRLDDEN